MSLSIETMTEKPEDSKDFKETEYVDLDTLLYTMTITTKIADGEDGKAIMGTKTVVTDKLLAKVMVQKFHKTNEENRSRNIKYNKNCGLLLTSIKEQIEPTIISLIMGQPGY